MAQNKVNGTKSELLEQLMAVVQELPKEQIAEVSDFARGLRDRKGSESPERGSMDAIMQALKQTGPLQFEAGELETLLAEIEAMRDLHMEEHG